MYLAKSCFMRLVNNVVLKFDDIGDCVLGVMLDKEETSRRFITHIFNHFCQAIAYLHKTINRGESMHIPKDKILFITVIVQKRNKIRTIIAQGKQSIVSNQHLGM